MRAIAIFAGLVGLALTACGEPEPAGGAMPPPSNVATVPSSVAPPTTAATDVVGSNGPFDPDATMRPDLIVIEPDIAGAGEYVTVTYPGGRERGIAYVLERSHDGSWHTTHFMTAANDSPDRVGREPTWAEFGTLGYGWEAIGISGPGPDTLVIPAPALAGDYRICTANSAENICAEITLVEPDEPTSSATSPAAPLAAVGGPTYAVGAALVADHLELPLPEFERQVVALGYGPVRVAWQDGDYLGVTEDLMVGRVNVAVETRDGTLIVIDAFVENDLLGRRGRPRRGSSRCSRASSSTRPVATSSSNTSGSVWYQVQQEFEYPEIYDRGRSTAYRENIPEDVAAQGFAPHGFAARVVTARARRRHRHAGGVVGRRRLVRVRQRQLPCVARPRGTDVRLGVLIASCAWHEGPGEWRVAWRPDVRQSVQSTRRDRQAPPQQGSTHRE